MSQASGEVIHAAISYSRADQARVEQLLAGLKGSGLSIWFDKDIPGGALWEEIIARKYRASGALLFFVSKASLASQRCSEEVSTARTLGKPIIPVLLDPLKLPDDLPDRFVLTLQARNTVDAFDRPQGETEAAILTALDGFGIKPGSAPLVAAASAARAASPPPAQAARPRGNGLWMALGGAFAAIALVIAAYFAFVAPGDKAAPAGSVAATTATTVDASPAATAQPAAATSEPAAGAPVPPAPATEPGAAAPKLTIANPSYAVGIAIKAKIADVPGNERDYVAVARAGAKPGETISTLNTGGATAKSLTLQPVMKEGDYELRLFYGSDETPVIRASVPFNVTPPAPVTITLGKPSYAEGERISLTYRGLPGNERDWISVAKADAAESSYIVYEYTKGQVDGSLELRPMIEPGEFEIRVFFDDSTGDKTVRARQTFMVTPAPKVVASLDAESYEPGRPIRVSFSSMPGNDRDWFAVAKAGSADTAYVSYIYTQGNSSGEVELKAPAEAGDYEVRGYFDDATGDKTVRVRVAFRVAAAAAKD